MSLDILKNYIKKRQSNEKTDNSEELINKSRRIISQIKSILDQLELSLNQINNLEEEEKQKFYSKLNGNIQILNQYVKILKKYALALVNGKYKNTVKGNNWNLNFLSKLNQLNLLFQFGNVPEYTIRKSLEKYRKIFDEIKL